jgi:predicted CoA-substrate-specific enzyme activase
VVATGYGRIALSFAHKAVTEITCHARGIASLLPAARMIIDIGGQDSKVIKIADNGQVLDFVMNDKCAAGTGRFLEVIAAKLGADVNELSDLAAGEEPVELNSMCTVFAESEVVGLLAQGRGKGEIVAGLNRAIARRIAGMAGRLSCSPPAAFTGGVARNESLAQTLEKHLNMPLTVPDQCQFSGAIGAMLIALDLAKKKTDGALV